MQNDGDVWPKEGLQRAVCPGPADLRLGNVSLIPLRGSANEMRNSVAAFSPEALAVSEVTNPGSQSGGPGGRWCSSPGPPHWLRDVHSGAGCLDFLQE